MISTPLFSITKQPIFSLRFLMKIVLTLILIFLFSLQGVEAKPSAPAQLSQIAVMAQRILLS